MIWIQKRLPMGVQVVTVGFFTWILIKIGQKYEFTQQKILNKVPLKIPNFNSHGTRRLYPPRYEMAQKWRAKMLMLNLTWIMYFSCPKNSIRGLKMSFPVNFRSISGEISAKTNFWKNFIAPKDSSLDFRGVSLAIFELSCSFPPLSAF